mmetsp:Transcript_4777/g.10968  ORF Transcript_4777/g.10968 Transcript_4777/m.10968 type:complete len:379 (-) Transcript_4777:302-1438(-)
MLSETPPFSSPSVFTEIDRVAVVVFVVVVVFLLLLRLRLRLRLQYASFFDLVIHFLHGSLVFGRHIRILRTRVVKVIASVVVVVVVVLHDLVVLRFVLVPFRIRSMPQGSSLLAGSSAIDGSVHFQETKAVDVPGPQIVGRRVGVIQAISQVLVVEILVRVGQAESVANLVAHRVQSLVVVGIEEVVFVHFGDARLDDSLWNRFEDLVDSEPARFAVISVANLHHPVCLRALSVHFDLLARQLQNLRSAQGVPIRNGLLVFRRPRVVEGIPQLQGQSTLPVRVPHPDVGRVVPHKGILVPHIGRESGEILQDVRKVAKVNLLDLLPEVDGNVDEFVAGGFAQEKPGGVCPGTNHGECDDCTEQAADAASFFSRHSVVR